MSVIEVIDLEIQRQKDLAGSNNQNKATDWTIPISYITLLQVPSMVMAWVCGLPQSICRRKVLSLLQEIFCLVWQGPYVKPEITSAMELRILYVLGSVGLQIILLALVGVYQFYIECSKEKSSSQERILLLADTQTKIDYGSVSTQPRVDGRRLTPELLWVYALLSTKYTFLTIWGMMVMKLVQVGMVMATGRTSEIHSVVLSHRE